MSRPPFQVLQISELDSIPIGDALRWRPVRRTLGIEAFGINAYTADDAGDEIVEEHDETGDGAGRHEELYVVLDGHVRFTLDGDEVDAPAGTLVFLGDPTVKRHAHAVEPGSTVLAIGGRAGEAYEVSPWEYYFAAIPAAKAGDWDAALAVMEEGRARYGDNPAFLYNLGCFEARAGRREDAIAHVRRSIEQNPKFREYAVDDEDLASIRGELGLDD